ncbi:MAG: hypothetical protein OXQ94_15595 [Gemmatimonadota bacterium]|nr:hypothetical protein [Gemmatimonadota bacterium]MDE2873101.1 hypothetical protein [Gemmatimonadota bacterium]
MKLEHRRRGGVPLITLAGLAAVLLLMKENDPSAAPAPAAAGSSEIPDLSTALEIHAVVEWRIAVTWNPEYDWNRGSGVVISEDGRLFVSQYQDRSILAINASGETVREIGRAGEGPGEFSFLSSIGLLGDTLVASDRNLWRVSFFDTAGKLLETRRWFADMTPQYGLEGGLSLFPAPPTAFLGNGLALVLPNMALPMLDPQSAGVQSSGFRVPLLTIDDEGRVLDTLAWDEHYGSILSIERGGRVFSVGVPFQPRTFTRIMPSGGGVVIAKEGDPAEPTVSVARVGPSGDTLFARSYRYAPVPLTDDLVQGALFRAQVLPPGIEDAPPGIAFEGSLRDSGLLPATLPALTGLAVGQDESIWLRREEPEGETVAWTVLDGMGRMRGFVSLPDGQRVVAARGAVMVAVEEDELGRVTLVRYLVPAPGG